MIMRRVIDAFGADYLQWRVLTRVMLKSDFRGASGLNMGRTNRGIWFSFVIYGLFGGVMALVAGFVATFLSGLMLIGTIVLTQVSVLLTMVVLIDFQSVVVSPDDYDILSHQPVSSRTYFLVKLTNVLIFTLIIAALLGGPSVILLFATLGVAAAVGGLVALAGIAIATPLAILVVYAALMQVVHPHRLRRVLSAVQLIAVFAVMIAPIYVDDLFAPALERVTSDDGVFLTPLWVYLAPPAWFASFLPLFTGDWDLGHAVAAAGGAASVLILFFLGAGRLSVAYAERLGVLTANTERSRRFRRDARVPLSRSGLGRFLVPSEVGVMATLVRAQFRDDMRFRMAVLGYVPAILAFWVAATEGGRLADPFLEVGPFLPGLTVLNFTVIGFPLVIVALLPTAQSWRASWIFFTTPVDGAKLVVSAGLCVTLFVVVPTAFLIAGILMWSLGNPAHAAAHALVLALLAHLAVQGRQLISPRLPFSRPQMKGGSISGALGGLLVVGGIGILLPWFFGVVYADTKVTATVFGLLLAAAVVAPGVVRMGVRSRLDGQEFAG